ncbi:MAG: ATP-dependent metallopeptidase FtsH/Yme1/Tma family protein, partial [Flavobacteriaceae bacterium]|nr:ATP-dependent metallopeptidase FtsH/Yme1/Tma family protein [Flavobacteriaceae bacterium]
MSKDNKPKNKKINHWLIYGGALALILAFQLFSGGLGNSSNTLTTPSQFFKFLKDGDVKKVEIVNKREALVYLTTKAISKDIHKKNKKTQFFSSSSDVPNYKFEFGDVQLFQKQLEDTIKLEDLDTSLNFKSETNAWGDIISSLIPFILIIGIWIFIMRRVSGGGAAGGGQIFNIGKSKAKL